MNLLALVIVVVALLLASYSICDLTLDADPVTAKPPNHQGHRRLLFKSGTGSLRPAGTFSLCQDLLQMASFSESFHEVGSSALSSRFS